MSSSFVQTSLFTTFLELIIAFLLRDKKSTFTTNGLVSQIDETFCKLSTRGRHSANDKAVEQQIERFEFLQSFSWRVIGKLSHLDRAPQRSGPISPKGGLSLEPRLKEPTGPFTWELRWLLCRRDWFSRPALSGKSNWGKQGEEKGKLGHRYPPLLGKYRTPNCEERCPSWLTKRTNIAGGSLIKSRRTLKQYSIRGSDSWTFYKVFFFLLRRLGYCQCHNVSRRQSWKMCHSKAVKDVESAGHVSLETVCFVRWNFFYLRTRRRRVHGSDNASEDREQRKSSQIVQLIRV